MGLDARRALGLLVVAGALVWGPASAVAHPEVCHKDSPESVSELEDEGCFSEELIAGLDDSGAQLAPGELGHSSNMQLLSNTPKFGPFAGEAAFNSDIAFWGKYAIQGNYNGFQVTDVSDPEAPAVVSQVRCPGSQNDVSVWRNLIFTSTDSRRSDASCDSFQLASNTVPSSTDPNAEYWEGIKIFDWSNPAAPRLVTAVETDCGSHTHTIVPEANRVLIYVSSYDLSSTAKDCMLTTTPEDDHDKISIIEVPLADPAAARVVAEPVLFPDGGFAGTPSTRQTRGCHDITVYPALDLAAGACMGEGILMDISDPLDPKVISTVTDPNFAFWHSATFTHAGGKVLFTDELGGGSGATCNPAIGPNRGANAIYDVSDRANPQFRSYFKIPRNQAATENCVAHNGVFLPTNAGDYFVQAWYQGGTSVIDLNGVAPTEIAYFDRGPVSTERNVLGGAWSSYFYNGFIYVNDIQRGLDVLKFTGPEGAQTARNRMPRLNAQTQEPLGR